MFTGLVSALGQIEAMGDGQLRIRYVAGDAETIAGDLAIGDSVAVDGVCLTVETILPQGFAVAVSPETLARSTLANARSQGIPVNLEASLRVGSKIGGHFVTGHVDGVGSLVESQRTENSWEMTFAPPPKLEEPWHDRLARYLVPKGSIAVNGISLTVSACAPAGQWFKVAVIPHTYGETNLSKLQPGSWVNLEGDVLGKYVEKFLSHGRTAANGSTGNGNGSEAIAVTPDFLAEHGYS